MKVIAALLLGVVAAAIIMMSLLIQLLMQLLPLLVLAAVVVGVVKLAQQRRPSAAPPGYMLVPIPGHPTTTAPQLALPAPRRNPIDVEVFGPVHPGDGSSPDRWEWR